MLVVILHSSFCSLKGMEPFAKGPLLKRKRNAVEELFKAVESNQFADVETYLKNGGNPHVKDSSLKTLLHIAAIHNRLRIARLLVAHQASRSIQDDTKRTPLHWAAIYGHEGLMETLSCFDALIIQDTKGFTPLHWAVYRGNTQLTRILLSKGGSPNTIAADSCTPLHDAALNGHASIVEALLGRKALTILQDKDFWTPLHYAALYNHFEVIKLLLPHCTKNVMGNNAGQTPLHLSIRATRPSFEVIRLLLTKKEWVSARDNKRETPLHYAAHLGLDTVVEELLKHQANALVLNEQNQTPCDLARERNHKKVISLLEEQSSPVLF